MSAHLPIPNTLIVEPTWDESRSYLVSAIYPSSVASGAVTLGIVTENRGQHGVLLDLDDAVALRDHLNTLIEQAGDPFQVVGEIEVPC